MRSPTLVRTGRGHTALRQPAEPVVRPAEAPEARTRVEGLDATHIRRLRQAIRWEALTRAQHRLAVEALRELGDLHD